MAYNAHMVKRDSSIVALIGIAVTLLMLVGGTKRIYRSYTHQGEGPVEVFAGTPDARTGDGAVSVGYKTVPQAEYRKSLRDDGLLMLLFGLFFVSIFAYCSFKRRSESKQSPPYSSSSSSGSG